MMQPYVEKGKSKNKLFIHEKIANLLISRHPIRGESTRNVVTFFCAAFACVAVAMEFIFELGMLGKNFVFCGRLEWVAKC